MTTMDERVKQYIAIRDILKKMDEAHENKRKEFVTIQEHLGGILSEFLTVNKLENLKTEHGTCYVSTRYSASLADPDAFMNFVKANDRFDLLDRRANNTAVKDYVQEHNALPPGCNLSAIQTVGVRRPSGK